MSKNLKNKKVGIVLFNLGGPCSQESVRPFLFNLFKDKYIIPLPKILRYLLAWFLSFSREKTSQEIYSHLGGKSTLLEETKVQLLAIEEALKSDTDIDFKIFISMRYWYPMSDEVIEAMLDYNPSEIILLPLYPQFSTTTTLSSIEDFLEKMKRRLPNILYKTICCYSQNENFIQAHVHLIEKFLQKIQDKDNYRILFSAHSLPKKTIDSGDPYQWQIESTVMSIIDMLSVSKIDYKISYQSKVGPLEWIGPSTENEIEKAGQEGRELLVVPIAFVSEHPETLVELDIEYKTIADKYSINYIRVPTLSINRYFIDSLKNIVIRAINSNFSFLCSDQMVRVCPKIYSKCPCKR